MNARFAPCIGPGQVVAARLLGMLAVRHRRMPASRGHQPRRHPASLFDDFRRDPPTAMPWGELPLARMRLPANRAAEPMAALPG